ncbi:hypothetical protein ED208_10810 [Stagnimonas aquatica]|uniref:Uncharacterized protein n=1 Tax=Stagnimonas aquatica TaxID=2689987 RepID=A0A3N0VA79_9GAMM|nr:hypothetical protein [Stagnimonas aquatica]ROH89609.1 hypothetical protein ED208_10810 [Stagnimonas aquatica]
MRRLQLCGFVLCLVATASVAAEAPRRYLYPVPGAEDACVQTCLSEHEICLLGADGEPGLCGDEQRLCVERCDPQMMNTVLTGTVEDRHPRGPKTP